MSESQQQLKLPEGFYDKTWKPGLLYGRKQKRLLSEDYDEVYVEDLNRLPDEVGYAVKYREGRFGPSETLKEFEDEETALEFVEDTLSPE